jgi:hypothetical protein
MPESVVPEVLNPGPLAEGPHNFFSVLIWPDLILPIFTPVLMPIDPGFILITVGVPPR